MALMCPMRGTLVAVTLLAVIAGCKSAVEPQTSGGRAAVRRLTGQQYRQIIADIFGPDIKVVGRFDPEVRKSGLLAVGAGQVSISSSGFEQFRYR